MLLFWVNQYVIPLEAQAEVDAEILVRRLEGEPLPSFQRVVMLRSLPTLKPSVFELLALGGRLREAFCSFR